MKKKLTFHFSVILLVLLALLLAARLFVVHSQPVRADTWTPVPGDEHWVEGFDYPGGFTLGVFAMTTDEENVLYAGGMYSSDFGVLVTAIASWDGLTWTELGILRDQSSTDGWAYDLLIDASGDLYVGGSFSSVYIYNQAGSEVQANGISRWDGSAWSALGSGVNGYVTAMAMDGDGHLYAGGSFSSAGGLAASNVAMWNGFSWEPLGDGLEGPVAALAVDNAGALYAGGEFSNLGGQAVSHVARWDGDNWSPLEDDVTGSVNALVLDNAGNLYAGGTYEFVNGNPVSRVSRWDGGSWSVLAADADGLIYAMAVDSTGNLYIGGEFSTVGAIQVNYLARWDGLGWESVGGGVDEDQAYGGIVSLTVDSNNLLYAGGDFKLVGGTVTNAVAAWDGADWNSLGEIGAGMDAWVYHLALDSDNNLYAAGWFYTAGEAWVINFARWDGTQWSALNGSPALSSQWVDALLVDPNNADLYTVIYRYVPYVGASSYLYRYDGNSWTQLATIEGGQATALAMDNAGRLYVGGGFSQIGGVDIDYLARWDGSLWTPLGSGLDGPVYSLMMDASGNLYVGGGFTAAGGQAASNIARWDGASWSSLGAGTDGYIEALALDPMGNLYVGGSFSNAGGAPANDIARWDGTAWAPLGSGLADTVYRIAIDEAGNLFAGGTFATAGETTFNYIARWDGDAWQPLGSGVDGWVLALVSDAPGSLYVGGQFRRAGDKNSSFIGQWKDAPPQAVGDSGPLFTTDEATAFTTGNVLSNDYDPDYTDSLSLVSVDASLTIGRVTNNGDGTFEYDPDGQFDTLTSGQQAVDTFRYTISDGILQASAAVTVTITGAGDLPAATATPTHEPPAVMINMPGSAAEGSPLEFSLDCNDPGLTERLVTDGEVHWDFGDGYSMNGVLTTTHTYADNGLYTVTLSVIDPLGGPGQSTLPVEVLNVGPVVDLLAPASIYIHEPLFVQGSITDPGWLDTFTVRIEWEPGVSETLNLPPGVRSFVVSHPFELPGVHQLRVSVTDNDGAAVTAARAIEIDPRRYFLPLLNRSRQ